MKEQWWQDKIFYQIYPKSFCDSNGDGIGDIPGIISKLDYIRSLGVDLIWLSPVYKSPFQDQGYDIADYYAIDPVFGTMADMERLIAEAKKRGMGILMDLVVNHCSDEHAWFQACIDDPHGKYGDYFYLSPPHKTNNLRSYFGGSVWEPLPKHPDIQYLHLFDKKQPDLNWENPTVRDEICDMVNWWLDKGLAGFRIDAIMNIKKPLPFHDYQADRSDGRCSAAEMIADAEEHHGGVHAFLTELKERCFAPHNTVTIGEVFDADSAKLKRFIGRDGHFSSMFDFAETCLGKDVRGWQYATQHIAADDYRDTVFHAQMQAGDSCLFANVLENHDEPRGVSHYLSETAFHNPQAKKLLACMYYLLRGLPFIYQGQELGMENVPFTDISQINDINTLDEYKNILAAGATAEEALRIVSAFSRDNARTPMQWSDAHAAGFTSGSPWLMVNPNYTSLNVAAQEADKMSVLHFYRALAALRKHPAYKDIFVHGRLLPVFTENSGLMAYVRELPESSVNVSAADFTQAFANAAEPHAEHTTSKETEAPHRILVLGNFRDHALNLQDLLTEKVLQEASVKLMPQASLSASTQKQSEADTSAQTQRAAFIGTQKDAETKICAALKYLLSAPAETIKRHILLNNYDSFTGDMLPYQAIVIAL